MKLFYSKIKAAFMSESGFSLVELMIAAALVAIVAAGFTYAVQGNAASIAKLEQVQTKRERYAGDRDAFLAKSADAIKTDVANRAADPDKTNYQLINVSVAGQTFTCYKIEDEGTNLAVFVEKPTESST